MNDINYCSSSFLMYRAVDNLSKSFNKKEIIKCPNNNFRNFRISDSISLDSCLRDRVKALTNDGKAALALSGGIDSAIIAKYMPKGSTAYTFKCVVPGREVTDESLQAAKYAKECGLIHKIVEITWEDMKEYSPRLMLNKNAPIHSIEVQIYKAALEAKKEGFQRMIFGEPADVIFGGLDKLLSRDWTLGEFIERYSYILPYKVLKEYYLDIDPMIKHCKLDGYVDVYAFLNEYSHSSDVLEYYNPCSLAEIEFIGIYEGLKLSEPLDINRIRNGEPKYLINELFRKYYKGWTVPHKIPFPMAVGEWLKDWKGPVRKEFWRGCTDNMTADQRWMVYILEQFLNLNDKLLGE